MRRRRACAAGLWRSGRVQARLRPYPPEATQVDAVKPDPRLRALAERARGRLPRGGSACGCCARSRTCRRRFAMTTDVSSEAQCLSMEPPNITPDGEPDSEHDPPSVVDHAYRGALSCADGAARRAGPVSGICGPCQQRLARRLDDHPVRTGEPGGRARRPPRDSRRAPGRLPCRRHVLRPRGRPRSSRARCSGPASAGDHAPDAGPSQATGHPVPLHRIRGSLLRSRSPRPPGATDLVGCHSAVHSRAPLTTCVPSTPAPTAARQHRAAGTRNTQS